MKGLIIDNFAGGGGASTGLEQAFGRAVDFAINHDQFALAMHRINHPDTKHLCENVWDIQPGELCKDDVLAAWFSPDCRHFSKAKGAKPVEKKIRGLAWIVLRWAKIKRPTLIGLENVTEFQTWGRLNKDGKPSLEHKGETFRSFVNALKHLGYKVEHRVLVASDFGIPTLRERFFLIARNDNQPIVFPEPTHGKPNHPMVKLGLMQKWKIAADCIDWNLPCPSIFNRKRPLAEATINRIYNGIQKHIVNNPNPFVVSINGQLVAPLLTECANASSPRCMPVNEPFRTITAQVKGGHHAIIFAFLTVFYGNDKTGQSLDQPFRTITSKDKFGLVTVEQVNYQITDIGFRMVQPKELYKGQGFPDDYIFDHGIDENGELIKLTKAQQTAKVGNSVPPGMVKMLIEANLNLADKYQGVA
ncbi:DNA (cytosine-5-)-methyltransferase [Acinetobacter junii]|uniref:DNA (cytosine-5-)-methyltransferase n=1 Tax=Acinetobacter junii TaxID=40215 RepID=A0ABU8ZCN2_ACIJU